MHRYQYNDKHERVVFSEREVISMCAVIAKCDNDHAVFKSIAAQFAEGKAVNISSKQVDVLERSFRTAALPSVAQTCASNPFAASMRFRGSKEAALRSVLGYLDGTAYGDWSHSADLLDVLHSTFAIMEVTCNDGTYYIAFAHPADLNTAEIALDGAGWLM